MLILLVLVVVSLLAQMVKHLLSMQETWVQSLDQEDHLKKGTDPTPALLPGKSHGQRSLIGYSPWSRKESDTTEQLHFTGIRQLGKPITETVKPELQIFSLLGHIRNQNLRAYYQTGKMTYFFY